MEISELKNYLKNLPNLINNDGGKRKERAIKDFRYFCVTYFPHHIGLNVGESFNDTSKFRNFIYKNLGNIAKKYSKTLLEAYRGASKTTIISRLFSLWQLLGDKKDYCVIIGASNETITETSETIRTELEENELLKFDFNIKQGTKWTNENFDFTTDNKPKKYRFYGVKKKIRGANFRGKRPDLILCDDIENDENVESKSQRDKLYSWFNKAVLKLPARQNNNYNIIVVGTRLHHDGLLARLKNSPNFYSLNFPLVLEFPSNLDKLNAKTLDKADLKSFKIDDERLNKIEKIGRAHV